MHTPNFEDGGAERPTKVRLGTFIVQIIACVIGAVALTGIALLIAKLLV